MSDLLIKGLCKTLEPNFIKRFLRMISIIILEKSELFSVASRGCTTSSTIGSNMRNGPIMLIVNTRRPKCQI